MRMYDVTVEYEWPEPTEWNVVPVSCMYCGREVPPDNAAKQIKWLYWLDWDDPDPDAQGQYKRRKEVEWYCCGFADGFGSLDCTMAIIGQGIDAKPESLRYILESDMRRDLKAQAAAVAREQAQFNRDTAQLLAEIEHYGRHDDNSPGQVGGGRLR